MLILGPPYFFKRRILQGIIKTPAPYNPNDLSMSTNEHSSADSDGSMYYVIFFLLVCILIMGPCLFFRFRVLICFRRIRQRRWNVATDDIVHPSIIDGEITHRAPDDPSYVATKEDAEKINMKSLLRKLKDYTKVRSS